MDSMSHCALPLPRRSSSPLRVRSLARSSRHQRSPVLRTDTEPAQVFLSHGANEARLATKERSSRCVTTFTTNNNCGHRTARRISPYRHHVLGCANKSESGVVGSGSSAGEAPLSRHTSGVGAALSGDAMRTPRRPARSVKPLSTFEAIWGSPPGLPVFTTRRMSVSGRPAATSLMTVTRATSGAADAENTTTTATNGRVAVSVSGNGCAGDAGTPSLPGLAAAAVLSCSSEPESVPFIAEGAVPLPSPNTCRASNLDVSRNGARVVSPHSVYTPESDEQRYGHAHSLELSNTSPVTVSSCSRDATHSLGGGGDDDGGSDAAQRHHRPHPSSHRSKKKKRTLSVFMILEDVAMDAANPLTASQHPLRFPSRSRIPTSSGTSGTLSYSHRRVVVSVDDGATSEATSASEAFRNIAVNADDFYTLDSQPSEDTVLTIESVRSRLGIMTTTASAGTPARGRERQGQNLPQLSPGRHFSLCSQLVNGGAGGRRTGHRRSFSGTSTFLRSVSCDWNTSLAVAEGPGVGDFRPDRRTRPRWQTSSRGPGLRCTSASSAADGVMEESAFPIINFDFNEEGY